MQTKEPADLLSPGEKDLITEALRALLATKKAAHAQLQEQAQTVAFNTRDFGIPQIEDLLSRLDPQEDGDADAAAEVTAEVVPAAERIDYLPTLFGRESGCLTGDLHVIDWMSAIAPAYAGDSGWAYYRLSNGGGFMAPSQRAAIAIECHSNGYSGRMSSEAAGIVATLYALSHMASRASNSGEEAQGEFLSKRYHELRAYAQFHPEMEAIFAAID